ncbi:zinc carboxypeptidase [Kineococcus xinjiangensis]|uniref:Zinc carboxypeptidase n=1 Tax=Kineococcus xinjiangensis TaxID=512762 RepID=A0A2S6IV54_9ACTN|nr:zinc carboxypeptidase [Kineococcus xinjiangensis]
MSQDALARRRAQSRPSLPRRTSAVAAIALAAAAFTALPSAAEETVPAAQLVRVSTPTWAERDLLTGLGLDLTEHGGPGFVEVVLHGAGDADVLREAGLDFTVEIPDLALAWARSNQASAAYAASVESSPLPSGRDTYRSLEDYEADLDRLARAHPGLVKPITLPHKTLEGRTVRGVEITENAAATDGKPVFLLMGLHHVREWPGGEHAVEFAFDLAQNYGQDERITRLLRSARVVVVPVVNPDGYATSYADGALLDLRESDDGGTVTILGTPGNAYKRKNCRPADGVTTSPAGACAAAKSQGGFGIGVDLNRNYGGFWGGPGASSTPADPTYRGEAPFSEPETRNVRDLVSSRQVTTLISNHTFSNLVLRPPALRSAGDTPDEPAYADLGARMAANNGYTNQKSFQLYDTTGGTEDWSYYATGGLGFTFEIGEEFHPPYNRVVDHYLGAGDFAGKGNREAYLVALESAASPALHSVIAGKAPAGATLTLEKSFATLTSPVESPTGTGQPIALQDRLATTMTVPAGGRYEWHVNPSTRPVVMERRLKTTASEPTASQTFSGVAPTPVIGHVDHEFTVTAADQALLQVDLTWPTPDDMDLEVYRKAADGTLTRVASSGNFLGEKETAVLESPEPGTYVLRVINFASASPTYEVTAAVYGAGPDQVVGGLVENWTLSCAGPDGTVHERVPVVVDRGQQAKVDLKKCATALGRR